MKSDKKVKINRLYPFNLDEATMNNDQECSEAGEIKSAEGMVTRVLEHGFMIEIDNGE